MTLKIGLVWVNNRPTTRLYYFLGTQEQCIYLRMNSTATQSILIQTRHEQLMLHTPQRKQSLDLSRLIVAKASFFTQYKLNFSANQKACYNQNYIYTLDISVDTFPASHQPPPHWRSQGSRSLDGSLRPRSRTLP